MPEAMQKYLAMCCVFVLAALVLSACDTVGPGTITLQKDLDFRFEFSTSGTDAGEELDINASGSINFDDVLAAEGFSKGDIIRVEVRSVQLDRIAPPGTMLDVFERLAFSVTASGSTVPTIAEIEDPPSSRDADLSLRVTDITQAVRQPTFRGRLTVVPRSSDAEEYVLTATIDLAVEVEGV